MYRPGRIVCVLTKVNPSHNLEIIEPSEDLFLPSTPYFVLISKGIKEAGTEKIIPIIKTAGKPNNLYARENSKGVNNELI